MKVRLLLFLLMISMIDCSSKKKKNHLWLLLLLNDSGSNQSSNSKLHNLNPYIPADLTFNASQNSIEVKWKASTDKDGTIVGYEVSLNQKTWESSNNHLNHNFTNLETDKSYNIQVRSKDNKNNYSLPASLNIKTKSGNSNKPNTPISPNLNPTMPKLAFESKPNSIQLTWEASKDQDGTIEDYEVKVDNEDWKSLGTNLTYSLTDLDIHKRYNIEVRAKDNKGNYSSKASLENITCRPRITSGINYSFLEKDDGSLWAFGNNDRGQLGLNNTTDTPKPKELTFFKNKVKQVYTGKTSMSTFVQTKDGKLYAFGNNTAGQLGLNHNKNILEPTEITFFKEKKYEVKNITVGHISTFVETKDGRLFGFGSNMTGELGLGDLRNNHQVKPTEIIFFKNKVKQIALGAFHSLVLTKDNKLFGFGSNFSGQLGLKNDENNRSRTFAINQLVFFENRVKAISAGNLHSLVLTKDDKLYAFGDNHSGQLGLDLNSTEIFEPTEVKFFRNKQIRNISAGTNHTFVQTKDYLFGFGSNLSFELNQKERRNYKSPIELKSFRNKAKNLYIGGLHTFVETPEHKFIPFGNNEEGQYGLGYKNTLRIQQKEFSLSSF